MDQTNEQLVQHLRRTIGVTTLNLIIDDYGHTFDLSQVLFENSIKHLAPGGFYDIERVGPEDLLSYSRNFASREFFVTHIQAPQGNGTLVGDNALFVIRKSTSRVPSEGESIGLRARHP